jgi:glycosyltransferase involved in cell wall biosynthesis
MLRFERDACRWFDGVVAVSDGDKEMFGERFGARRVFTIPTAVDTDYFRPFGESDEEGGLIFTGSMDWLPNEDAINFFAKEIMTRIKAHVPTARLTVVGRNPSQRLLRRLEGRPEITATGWVRDVRPYVGGGSVYVVPLRIGGGTRLKIYEAMAMGKAIVTTAIGAEGLPVRHGEHLIVADSPEDFAKAVVRLLRDSDERRRLEQAAREFVERNCSWERAAAAFRDACYAVASTSPVSRGRGAREA